MITKKHILQKTHYGLKIFAFILRQFYPKETVLRVNGKHCNPTFNPFSSHNKRSLQIDIVKGCGVYKDTMDKNFQGDVFDFAQMYFQEETERKLLMKINEVFHLNLRENLSEYEHKQQQIQRALDQIPVTKWEPRFSYFEKNLFNLTPTRTIGVLEAYRLLTDASRSQFTETLRNLSNEKEQRDYKKKHFDYVTFSGVFSKRNNQSLITHSQLLTVDIDGISNKEELIDIRKALLKDPYFRSQLLFISPRGNGLKWIIKISLEEVSHTEYFRAVSSYVQERYSIGIDTSGSDVSRGCLLPYDPDTYVNPKYLPDVKI